MGTCFLYGNGGSDSLRFRVYAATSLPASGKENDVCIITSTPISSWEAGHVDNPTWSMDAGFVYLTCTTSDASQPNLLRKNALYLKLTRCLQYENETWSLKKAYQYRGGGWSEIVGVYDHYVIQDGVLNPEHGVLKSENAFTLQGSGYYQIWADRAGYHTTTFTNIDMTYFRTLSLTGSCYAGDGFQLKVLTTGGTVVASAALTATGATIDISTLSGVHNVAYCHVYTNVSKLTELVLRI